ncbi:uncharacterized protein LOC112493057 [Ziziphus jujuba]|uniref:Uncharacterized protein LOC112493057 n=1 Tax=Ziziphus jujuba TaxID=326968 RepID=A0ABM3ZZ19_ZIZJJ|nr:uncharacterized protein LOC112493057 [Ziziphus jujuba]XP_060669726.1 uncharacterized protein LOC112493057 [Ziziphus jujuba]XP_060669727.1 uncharacterized protein LOC112493057 [Ziziphus jujuba]XP_060669728.1 uncharacterized protein LOC112493057 [Ziziphus jujuba]
MEAQSNSQSSAPYMKKNLLQAHPCYAGFYHYRGPENQFDWTDDHLLNLKGIVLRRYTTPSQLAPVVKEGLFSLQGTVSHRTIGALMVSAWNLYYFPERKYVFPEIPTNTTPDDIDYTALRGNNNLGGVDEKIYWPVDDSVTCAIGAYVAACLLRLETKSASNFVNAWKHIKSRYSEINNRPFLIRGLNPIEENLDSIRNALQEWPVFTNTLARFLYHFNELRGHVKGYAKFAFEQHLSLTGLHSYHLFRRVATKLNATPDDLSLALDHRMTRRGLVVVKKILLNFDRSTDDKQRRQTWKYARLFDEEMFVDLQSRNCSELTFILATILKEMDEDQGVGDIAPYYIFNIGVNS